MDIGFVAGAFVAAVIFLIGAISYQAGKAAERSKMAELNDFIATGKVRPFRREDNDASDN